MIVSIRLRKVLLKQDAAFWRLRDPEIEANQWNTHAKSAVRKRYAEFNDNGTKMESKWDLKCDPKSIQNKKVHVGMSRNNVPKNTSAETTRVRFWGRARGRGGGLIQAKMILAMVSMFILHALRPRWEGSQQEAKGVPKGYQNGAERVP